MPTSVFTVDAPSDATSLFVSPTTDEPLLLLHVEDNAADGLLTQEHIRSVIANVQFENAARLADVTPEMAATASCAILDLSLPDAHGLEALHALRTMSDQLPIIVLTGFDDLEIGLNAIRSGAEDYLVKNYVDGDSLQRAIRYAIERRRLTIALREIPSHGAARPPNPVFPETPTGTHQVAVAIDRYDGEYTLRCESCDWEAERGQDSRHSWTERSLDLVLLKHVAFGGTKLPTHLPGSPATVEPASGGPSAALAREHVGEAEDSARDEHEITESDQDPSLPRRALLQGHNPFDTT